jgi:iron complex transport system ATP-binding protein
VDASILELDFPGVTASLSPDVMVLRSEKGLYVLTSAVVGGGLTYTRHIVNRHVSKDYHHPDPESDLRAYARSLGITDPFVGLMTAVTLDKARAVTLREGDLAVSAVVTVGLGNAASPGLTRPAALAPGTINLILLVNTRLSPAAMVGAVITATEVKAQLLLDRRVHTPEGYPATGTSTDAVVVACTDKGKPLRYTGPATPAGWLIGQSLRQAIQEALE